jgi:hypothetical protein
VADFRREAGPDELLTQYAYLFSDELKDHPILDLACGDGWQFSAQYGRFHWHPE